PDGTARAGRRSAARTGWPGSGRRGRAVPAGRRRGAVAADLLRRAVELAQPDDPAQPRALELYGEVLLAAGERERAREVLAEALARARAHGASDVATHARLVLSQFEPAAESTEEFALRAAQEFRASSDHL